MSGRFAGQVALVTGASKGTGRAIALRLAREGADVAITWFRDRNGAETVEAELADAGVRSLAVRSTLNRRGAAATTVREVEAGLGAVTLLVANAATGVLRPLRELRDRHWDWTMETNAMSFLGLVQAAREARSVVALSSPGATGAIEGYGVVGASKAAVESLVRHLAIELAPATRVNAISPGLMDTASTRSLFDDASGALDGARGVTPAGRLAGPDDVAAAAAFLLSNDASMITGQTLVVDGGYSARA